MSIFDSKKSDPLRQAFEDKKLTDFFTKEELARTGDFYRKTGARTIDDYVELVNLIAKAHPMTKAVSALQKKGLEAININPDRPLSFVYDDQKDDEARLSQGLSLYTDPLLLYAPVKNAAQKTISKIPDIVSDIKYGDKTFSATRGKLPAPVSGAGANVVRNIDDAIAQVRKEMAETGEILTEKEIIEKATKRLTFGIKADKAGKELVDMFGKKATDYGLEKDIKFAFKDKDASKVRDMADLVPTTKNLTTPLVDGSKSYSENLTDIAKQLEGKMVHGSKPGESVQPFSSKSEYFRQAVQKEYFKQNQLSVKQYEDYYKALINDKGRVDLPENFYAGLKPEEFATFKAYDNTRRQIPNLKQARKNLEEQGFSKTDFKNAAQNQKIYSYAPADYAAYRAKQAGYRSANYSGSKQEARVLGLKDYGIKLSEREQSIFDQVNFVWKTDTSTAIKKNEDLQKLILNNDDIINDLSYRVLNSGKLAKSKPKVTVDRLKNSEFNKDKYTQTFYETDHIMPVESANTAGVNALRNLQTLPKTLNNDFKKPFDKYVAKLLKQESIDQKDIDNVREIVDQARDLGVTLYIDEPAKFGYTKKFVGAPYSDLANEVGQIPYVMQTENIIKRYSPEASLRELDLGRGGADVGGSGEDISTGANILRAKRLQDLESVKALQERIKSMYPTDGVTRLAKMREAKYAEISKKAREELRNERPVKFKASELANVARELIFKPSGIAMTTPMVLGLNAVEGAYNLVRPGVENDIDMKEKFPNVYNLYNYYSSGIGPTPEEQTYIGFLDEGVRSVQKGMDNLGYGVLDLAFTIPDFAFGTKLQERLQKSYDENAKADPETFLGDAGAILTEFGVPGTAAFKFINFLRKGFKITDKSTEGLKGAIKYKTQISNVSKRVATVGSSAFLGEFVGGSRYNSVTRMSPDDPFLLDNVAGYSFENTAGLSGRELVLANFRNRLRFGAEGAIIGGLFPIVGPALYNVTKYGVIKPSAFVAGKGLQATNLLAVKPASYLLARTPGVAQIGQLAGIATGIGAKFLGKDILARTAVGLMGSPTLKQLPDFKDWRMFEVTSTDPLQRNLKKFDNFLSLFRDSANQSANRFFLSGSTDRSIKAISRKIEKQLDVVEKRAYNLAKGFLTSYNAKTTSPAKQDFYLDQVMSYLKGQIKKSDLPDVLQESAEALNKTFIQIKKDFADVLPDGAGLKDFLNTNLRQYVRSSFSSFTNPLYRPDPNTFNRAVDFMVDRISKNENMIEAALAGSKVTDQAVAIKDFARKQVESILQRGKTDNRDPLDVLSFIARQNLKMDDLVVQTGEELPDVIRKLLGEENNLRTSVMTTATDLASQTANLQMYDKLAKLGVQEGWLFRTAEEAIAAGVINPKLIGPRLPGLGKLNSSISEAYGGEDIVNSIVGSSGLLDNLLKNDIYQGLIAYKAMVQTGKTVYSPATQTRNFGSAGFFPLQSGHIGGAASVTDAFKIMLDDIFGAGKVANEQDLIDRITRKIELGVLDENVVVSELKDILQDLKKANFKSYASFADAVDNTKLSQTATRLYAGGDNVWKWYGHEFVMSQLKNGFKNVDEIKDAYKTVFKADINPTSVAEGVEQYAASLIRDTYPTYSKVPKLIQLIRRVPFIGNFVSFPAEILRTTFTTSAIAAKHIASNNPTLRELGYRTLMGQYLTFGGIGLGTKYIGETMSNMSSQQLKDLKEYFVPDFMRNSDLIPVTPMKDGVVKVFDNSRYFPYDLVSATVSNLMKRIFTSKERLDPEKIETDMFKDLYNYTGPFADLAGGTLFGTAIGYEPALTFLTGGRTKQGNRIYSETDTTIEKFDKMFAHTFQTINPGFVRTLQNLYKSAAGLLTGTGQPIKMTDEVFKLFGGSSVTIDVPGSFRYQIGELKSSFREPKVAEGFFRPDFRSGDQLVREYNEQNEEAFREQYEFFKLVRAARRNDFMKDSEIIKLLVDRVGKKTAANIISGRFTPLSYSRDALVGRYENVKRGNPDSDVFIADFLPFGKLEAAKARWGSQLFSNYEKEMNKEKEIENQQQSAVVPPVNNQVASAPPPSQLPTTPDPVVTAAKPDINRATGLTSNETALLSPSEQAIRQKQRVTGVL